MPPKLDPAIPLPPIPRCPQLCLPPAPPALASMLLLAQHGPAPAPAQLGPPPGAASSRHRLAPFPHILQISAASHLTRPSHITYRKQCPHSPLCLTFLPTLPHSSQYILVRCPSLPHPPDRSFMATGTLFYSLLYSLRLT